MDKEKIIFYTTALTNYFRGLADSKDEGVKANSFEWHLGLFAANQLLRIARSENPDIEELKLLVKVLEEGSFGSGWFDLRLQANHLLELISPDKAGI